MLHNLAVARLGARASNGLTPLMADIDDPDVLLQAGKRLMAGATASELAEVLHGQ